MPVSPGDTIEVACVHVFNNVEEVINVWHMTTMGGGTMDDVTADGDIAGQMGFMYSEIDSIISNSVDATEIRWRNLTADGPTRFIGWGAGYVGGTASAEALPPGDTLLLLLRTGVKNVQGRKYFPPFTEAAQSNGVWGAGTITAMGAFTSEVEAGFGGSVSLVDWEFRVYSRALGTAHPIIGTRVQPIVAYQRRRRQGRGS